MVLVSLVAKFWMVRKSAGLSTKIVVMVASSTPAARRSGMQVLEEVVDGVALDARPAERAAVGVGGGEHLVEVARRR